MVNLEEKRNKILNRLNKLAKEDVIEEFEKTTGPGLFKKIERLVKFPHLYIPMILNRLRGKFSNSIIETDFFGFRKLKVPVNDLGPLSILTFNFITFRDDIKLTKFLVKNFSENDVFYDIGANYGYYTYLGVEFCKEVHSFEPIPDVFEFLYLNLKDQENVFLNNVALSNVEGETEIYISKYGTGGSTIIKDVFLKKQEMFSKKIKIKTITLDNYLKNHKPPTIMKIDVEGAEKLVLEGGINFLKEKSPLIIMEVWREFYDEISSKAVKILLDLGYKPFKIDYQGNILPANSDDFTKELNFAFKK